MLMIVILPRKCYVGIHVIHNSVIQFSVSALTGDRDGPNPVVW